METCEDAPCCGCCGYQADLADDISDFESSFEDYNDEYDL